jgi:hypothetical protein
VARPRELASLPVEKDDHRCVAASQRKIQGIEAERAFKALGQPIVVRMPGEQLLSRHQRQEGSREWDLVSGLVTLQRAVASAGILGMKRTILAIMRSER